MPFKSDKQRKGFFAQFKELREHRREDRAKRVEENIAEEQRKLKLEEGKLAVATKRAERSEKLAKTKTAIQKARADKFKLSKLGKAIEWEKKHFKGQKREVKKIFK